MVEPLLGIVLFLVGAGLQLSGLQSGFLAGACVGAGIALAASALIRRRPHRDSWSKVDRFRLFNAAALWCNESPTGKLSDRGYAMFQRLKAAVDKGELEAVALNGSTANVETWVTRRDLMRYAVRSNEAPEFLFPGAK